MPNHDWKAIAQRLNERLAQARLSSLDVAKRAGVDRKTVDRLRAGRAVRPQTLQWIEQALGAELGQQFEAGDSAPARYGGYLRESVIEYSGDYVAYRRSYDVTERVVASHLSIAWDDAVNALRFTEAQENRAMSGKAYSYRFGGDVLIPPGLGIVHLVVRSDDGRVRLISTSMPREDQGTLYMKGFVLTLNELRDIGYYPVTSPIFLARIDDPSDADSGVIDAGHPRFDWAWGLLEEIEQRFLPRAPAN